MSSDGHGVTHDQPSSSERKADPAMRPRGNSSEQSLGSSYEQGTDDLRGPAAGGKKELQSARAVKLQRGTQYMRGDGRPLSRILPEELSGRSL